MKMLIELINDSDLTFQLDGEWLKAGEFKSEKSTAIAPKTTTTVEITPSTVEGISGVAWWVDTTGRNVYISMAMTRPRLGRSFFTCHAGVPPPNLKTALSSAAKLETSQEPGSFTGAGPGCEWVGTDDGVAVRILPELEEFEPLSAADLSPKDVGEEPVNASGAECTEIVPEAQPGYPARKDEGGDFMALTRPKGVYRWMRFPGFHSPREWQEDW
ncbi:Vps13c [Symbiodinium natans]|uniref:Vps13c protein n=1 Tax=Symbiodinium natans TaxID=878477 RepID=A0A812L041_9DINO|nr:Vps13c [Symbiodinium natans]